ncbi:TetR/AcrR family transcriptional regulator [Alginatibacterium sediminis]|uniref:TetR/AcrR family transcriptional regulator n=1 Tax=Alginatibacterium sediminis TaxID=2164068 RepID=A0A420E740_9ALTE|nr:TetR/AcrR family transcriptional regulator [Alginatibacterium sediminis]RKF14460.1 TetR/AcrR family transcriptional regulator [Alginatibacterium sediminis]
MLKEQIAAKLEHAFSAHGFATLSIAQLQQHSGVSLRTLYKYYPSKEAMTVAALEHRHQRYIAFLERELPDDPLQATQQIFTKLELWMNKDAPNGCLSNVALASFPDDPQILYAVQQHKAQILALFESLVLDKQQASAIYLLHEGVTSAWPVLKDRASLAAQTVILKLFDEVKSR